MTVIGPSGTNAEAVGLRSSWLSSGLWSDQTLSEVLLAALTRNADRRLRVWSSTRPYDGRLGDVLDGALRLADALREQGIRPGDRVVVQLPNWRESLVALVGTLFAGAVVVPIAPFYGQRDLRNVLVDSAACTLIVADPHADGSAAEAAVAEKSSVSTLEHVIVVGASGPPGVLRLDDLLASGNSRAPIAAGSPDDLVFLPFTSGTTGRAKGVLHTSRSLVAEAVHHSPVTIPLQLPALTASPLSHVAGLVTCLLVPVLRGEDVHMTDRWNAEEAVRTARMERLSLGSGVPRLLQSILERPEFEAQDLESTRYATLGGAPISGEFCARLYEDFDVEVIRVYGSTEQLVLTGATPADPVSKRLATDGRPLPGVELRIVGDDERPVGPNIAGDLWTRGPDLCAGYLDDDMTRESFTADGWFRTGDVAVVDDEGWLTIVDRKKDLIIRSGFNISAREVEIALEAHPAIAELAVVAEPDPRTGERVTAVVRQHLGSGASLTIADLEATLRRSGMARHTFPERVIRVTDFPRTATGKISKVQIRTALRSGQAVGNEVD